jgi:selenocysteine lyase/cysteine desulfurase
LRRRGFVFRHIEEMGALRISTAFFNFEKEIDRFAIALRELLR